MYSTKQLLNEKGRDIYRVKPDAQVLEAIEIMAAHNVGALVVMDDDDQLVGLVSERDYARKVILKGKASRTTPVNEIMSSRVVTVTESHSLDDCLSIMTKHSIRHLPVVEDGAVVGVLAIGDLVRAKMRDQEHQIESLELYISGSLPYS